MSKFTDLDKNLNPGLLSKFTVLTDNSFYNSLKNAFSKLILVYRGQIGNSVNPNSTNFPGNSDYSTFRPPPPIFFFPKPYVVGRTRHPDDDNDDDEYHLPPAVRLLDVRPTNLASSDIPARAPYTL